MEKMMKYVDYEIWYSRAIVEVGGKKYIVRMRELAEFEEPLRAEMREEGSTKDFGTELQKWIVRQPRYVVEEVR